MIKFDKLAIPNTDGSMSTFDENMKYDDIGVAVLLSTIPPSGSSIPPQHILIANAHLHRDAQYADVKLIQTIMLMNQLTALVMMAQEEGRLGFEMGVPGDPRIPIVTCGDLNSLPDSSVIQYLSNGMISNDHVDLHDHSYDNFLSCVCESVRLPSGEMVLMHPFKLKPAYTNEMLYSTYTHKFKGINDYIFYSSDYLTPTGLLGPVSMDWFKQYKVVGCPNPHYSSDHFSLLCEFMLKLPL